jgi:hypothetical protein
MGPLDRYILDDDALSAAPSGANSLQFHSHWYRSLPASCMVFQLKINGKIIEHDSITFEINDKQYPAAQIPTLHDEWLYILDAATLHLKNASVKQGEPCLVEFELGLFIPYILVGAEGKPLLASTRVTKTLICK